MQHQTHRVQFQGRERSYFTRTCESPRLAVVLLHPVASTGKTMAAGGGWLDRDDIAILAPDGLAKRPDEERADANPRCWSSEEEPARGRPVDDVAFIDNLLAEFLPQVEGVPVLLVGHSNGCAMGFRVLAESRFRKSFSVACLFAAAWAGVKAPLNIPLLYMTGDSDPIRPFHGEQDIVTPWFSLRATPVMDTVRDCLLSLNADGAASPMVDPQSDFISLSWDQGVAPFEFRILRGQGHHWPAGGRLPPEVERIVGPCNAALNATEMAIEFAEEHLMLV